MSTLGWEKATAKVAAAHREIDEVRASLAAYIDHVAKMRAEIDDLKKSHFDVSTIALEQTARLGLLCGERDALSAEMKRLKASRDLARGLGRDNALALGECVEQRDTARAELDNERSSKNAADAIAAEDANAAIRAQLDAARGLLHEETDKCLCILTPIKGAAGANMTQESRCPAGNECWWCRVRAFLASPGLVGPGAPTMCEKCQHKAHPNAPCEFHGVQVGSRGVEMECQDCPTSWSDLGAVPAPRQEACPFPDTCDAHRTRASTSPKIRNGSAGNNAAVVLSTQEIVTSADSTTPPPARGDSTKPGPWPPRRGDVWRHRANGKEYTFTGATFADLPDTAEADWTVIGGGRFHRGDVEADMTFVRSAPEPTPAQSPEAKCPRGECDGTGWKAPFGKPVRSNCGCGGPSPGQTQSPEALDGPGSQDDPTKCLRSGFWCDCQCANCKERRDEANEAEYRRGWEEARAQLDRWVREAPLAHRISCLCEWCEERRAFLGAPLPALTEADIAEARETIHSSPSHTAAMHCPVIVLRPGVRHSHACNKYALRLARLLAESRSTPGEPKCS